MSYGRDQCPGYSRRLGQNVWYSGRYQLTHTATTSKFRRTFTRNVEFVSGSDIFYVFVCYIQTRLYSRSPVGFKDCFSLPWSGVWLAPSLEKAERNLMPSLDC